MVFNYSILMFVVQGNINKTLDTILQDASMKIDKTVIITTLNDAWAEPNSIFDLFLESFHIGSNTERLLKHLVVICLDEKAYSRCLVLHPHCYYLQTKGANFTSEAFFMTPDYLQMMWRRIEFLITLLEKGYNFIFTVMFLYLMHIFISYITMYNVYRFPCL